MANTAVLYSQYDFEKLSHREQMELLETYYGNNDLYEVTRFLKYQLGVWNEDIRPLRTPVNRSVEFYVSKIAIGEPVISVKNKNVSVSDAIAQVMEWSNFNTQKPEQVRSMSLHGDVFRKVVTGGGKVWHETISTKDVTAFTEDNRGFLTSIRIDTPIIDDNDISKLRTEYWTVNDNLPYMAVWVHTLSETTPLNQLGDPIMYVPLSRFGIDFVPFTRSSFRRMGDRYGASCVQHALLKVDEANRQATRLHQILFRYGKALWVVSADSENEDGSPKPAPKVRADGSTSGSRDAEIRDNTILYLDGKAKIDSLVPNIPYEDALKILESQERELQLDLPELLFYSLPDKVGADASGKALRNLLGAAVDRATQAQANFVESTVRLNQMAITIGQYQGIFPTSLGTFDGGQLAHSLRFGEQFPMDISEKATALQTLVSALGTENTPMAMKMLGFSQEEIDEWVKPAPVATVLPETNVD